MCSSDGTASRRSIDFETILKSAFVIAAGCHHLTLLCHDSALPPRRHRSNALRTGRRWTSSPRGPGKAAPKTYRITRYTSSLSKSRCTPALEGVGGGSSPGLASSSACALPLSPPPPSPSLGGGAGKIDAPRAVASLPLWTFKIESTLGENQVIPLQQASKTHKKAGEVGG